MAAIRGRVIDAIGQPVAEASIYIISAPSSEPDIAVLTDADGYYCIGVSSPGRYTLGVNPGTGAAAAAEAVVNSSTHETYIETQLSSTES